MRPIRCVFYALSVLCLLSASVLAKQKPAIPEVPVWEKFPQLGTVHQLDVEFFAQQPAIEGQTPGSELPVTAVARLENNTLLPYKSPSDAILRFSCEGYECMWVKAQIVRRSDGAGMNAPILWEYRQSTFKWEKIPYYKLEPSVLAGKIMDKLFADVQSVKLVQKTAEASESEMKDGRIEPVSLDKPTP